MKLLYCPEFNAQLCDDLEGEWGEGEGGSRGRRRVYSGLIRVVAQQKLSQHCKAIVLQLRNKPDKKLQAQKATEARDPNGISLNINKTVSSNQLREVKAEP